MKRLFEIKNRFTGTVLFSLETESMKLAVEAAVEAEANLSDAYLSKANLSDAYLSEANLRGAYLSEANLSGAYLRGANLSGAYLRGANLRGAYLSGACLSGANLSEARIKNGITISKAPIQILGSRYCITIFDKHMQISCEFHSMAEWFEFSDKQILKMDGKRSMNFWKKWKDPLLQICLSEDRYTQDIAKRA